MGRIFIGSSSESRKEVSEEIALAHHPNFTPVSAR
jgi:hypothetical protein